MRILDIYFDVNAETFYDSAGEQLHSNLDPFVFYLEKPLLNIHLVTDNNLTPYTRFDASKTHVAVLEDDWDHSSTVLAKAVDADINKASEWFADQTSSSSGGTADIALGQISFRLDCATSEYQSAVDGSALINGSELEIQEWDSGELIGVVHIPLKARNIRDPNGATPASLGASHVSQGSVAIGNGDIAVDVTGLALSSVPATVLVTVRKPGDSSVGGFLLFAMVRDDSVTTDGFTVDLSAAAPATGYKLDYLIYY